MQAFHFANITTCAVCETACPTLCQTNSMLRALLFTFVSLNFLYQYKFVHDNTSGDKWQTDTELPVV